MYTVTLQLLAMGLYVMGLVFFVPSRATVWCTDWVDNAYRRGKCHVVFVLIGMALAVVLWPATQIAYAIYIERRDS